MSSNTCFLKMQESKYAVPVRSPKEIAPLVLQSINNLPLWSFDSLKNLHIGLQTMVIDFCSEQREEKKGSEKANYTRMMNKAKKVIHFTPRSKEDLLRTLYDIILESEGLGRLRGYGFTNKFGDRTTGNAEHRRLTRRII